MRWVELLLVGEFFGSCEQHKEDRKSEENIFCVDCGSRMCPHCLAGRHSDHRLLQIRRYVYQDVVRVHDMANLLDCSKVQVSDVDSPVLTVKEPTVCCQSEPLLADRPASSEEQPSPSPAASPPPFDEGQEDAGRSIPEPSVRKVHRRKGFPRRAPF
ncbi:hypothetical protein ZIOFF_003898 [Zingiber officinale]|uniref:B box-type domain-containing protein n=1 Tax=Zingiber officinale TaxID=94328 RepID=A0A8J5MAV8_ZINOF|nr:hypothetical protein ZIOFF_003898 [Zingiber officinale]